MKRRYLALSLILLFSAPSTSIAVLVCIPNPECVSGSPTACTHPEWKLPADVPMPIASGQQSDFDEYSWKTFLALNAATVNGVTDPHDMLPPQWTSWSSTADLLNQAIPGISGTRFYPDECKSIPEYTSHRVLQQVGPLDNSFLQAGKTGLNNKQPVIDRWGNFLRYEIMLNPALYNEILSKNLNKKSTLDALTAPVNLACGDYLYTGGDPANPMMGSIVLKVAWMDLSNATALERTKFHKEELLVYTPSYRRKDGGGQNSCEKKLMGMVGMHIEHKTKRQPNWIWSTFENSLNAPNCMGLPPLGTSAGPGPQVSGAGPNTQCPSAVTKEWNFYPQSCNSGDSCQLCNKPPASNATAEECRNPNITATGTCDVNGAVACTVSSDCPSGACTLGTNSDPGWCLNEGPAAVRGRSKLCRQIPPQSLLAPEYLHAYDWNNACHAALEVESVWSNYDLVSTQWINNTFPSSCANVASLLVTQTSPPVFPQAPVGSNNGMRPYLGNNSMESYDRPNCTGCHKTASHINANGVPQNLDFMFWLKLEVPESNKLGLAVPAFGRAGEAVFIGVLIIVGFWTLRRRKAIE